MNILSQYVKKKPFGNCVINTENTTFIANFWDPNDFFRQERLVTEIYNARTLDEI